MRVSAACSGNSGNCSGAVIKSFQSGGIILREVYQIGPARASAPACPARHLSLKKSGPLTRKTTEGGMINSYFVPGLPAEEDAHGCRRETHNQPASRAGELH